MGSSQIQETAGFPVLGGVALSLKEQGRSLWVHLEPPLSPEAQVTSITRSAFYQSLLVCQLQLFMDHNSLTTMAHALVTSRLDYCNTLYVGLPLYPF